MRLYTALSRLLFRMDPERAHRLTLTLLGLAGVLGPLRWMLRRAFAVDQQGLAVSAFGLRFGNPLGLAAGYDKDGRAMHGLACLGFGHLELGTVTPLPQAGNPRPRLFRLTEDEALINRMGFPNAGVQALRRRLLRRPRGVVIGVNIGKGSATPLEEAENDYRSLLKNLYPLVDYVTLNVSSPNTPGLRRLQDPARLGSLLSAVMQERGGLAAEHRRVVPVLVKLSPDLQEGELRDALEVLVTAGVEGVVATNTTVGRRGLHSGLREEAGGLSGRPLRPWATRAVARIHELTQGRLPIIAVGGVLTAEDVREKLAAGASLVQVYTGLVYRGPGLIREALDSLRG